MFFGNNKTTETTAPASAVKEEAESDIKELESRRDQHHAEKQTLQYQWDEINLEIRALRLQVAASDGKTMPGSSLGVSLKQALYTAAQLRAAIDEKDAQITKITGQINSILREEPARLRREALEACLPALFQFIDGACEAGRHEARFRELDGYVEHPIPWELCLAGGVGIEVETIISKWLTTLQREGVAMPGPITDNLRHLPPSTSHWNKIQIDAGYAGHAARMGAAHAAAAVQQALATGWRAGFLQRARGFR
jgi:hypothetical protein